MSNSDKPTIKRVAAPELCAIFNDGGYWDRAKSGELTQVIIEQRHPSLMKANEPFCTHSQSVSYRDSDGNEIVRVHQYLRPDNTIGASGRPDPKRLLKDGILYRLHKGS
jgi:hypothetical protein